MRIRLEDMTVIQAETRSTMEQGFKAQANAFEDAYEANSKNRKMLEDEITRLRMELRKKRKNDDMDADAEEEPREPQSDDDDENMGGARRHDMNKYMRHDAIVWMESNPEQKNNAAMIFDRNLLNAPETDMSV
eukprot:2314650-Heterocapsa_arctica.AAC.1